MDQSDGDPSTLGPPNWLAIGDKPPVEYEDFTNNSGIMMYHGDTMDV